MDKEQLFNILEKLLDELEYYSNKERDMVTYNHCLGIRQIVFTEDCKLSFEVKE